MRTIWAVQLVLALILVHEVVRSVSPSMWVGLALWLASIGVLVGHAERVDRRAGVPRVRWFQGPGEMAGLAALVGLAAVLRLARLGTLPAFVHHDTAECGLLGQTILSGSVGDLFAFSPWYDFPFLAMTPYAVSSAVCGVSIVGLRLATAVPGLLAVPALYYLVRGWYGRVSAWVAALLLAASHVAVHFSRSGIWNIQAVLCELVAFAALWTGIRRRSRRWLAVAGVVSGLAVYSYTAGRLAPALGLLTVGVWAAVERRRETVALAGYFVAGMLVVVAPLVASYVRRPEVLDRDRVGTVSVFAPANQAHVQSQVGSTDLLPVLVYQVKHTIAGLAWEGDSSSHYQSRWPVSGPVALALAGVGLWLLLRRFRDARSLFILSWLFGGLWFSSVMTINPPSFPRLLIVVPALNILAGVTFGEASARLQRTRARWTGWVAAAVLALAARSLYVNVTRYLDYSDRIDTQVGEWDLIQAIQAHPEARCLYLFSGPFMMPDSPTLRLFAAGRRLVYGITSRDLPDELAEPTTFLVIPQYRAVGPTLTQRFPDLERVAVDRGRARQLIVYSTVGPPAPAREGP